MSKYPTVSDPKFYDKISKIFSKYKIPKTKKTMKEICYPKKYQLLLPQQFLADFINPNTPYKDILVYHGLGSGKTCTSINIAEQWIGIRKIIVVVPAFLKGNYRNELRSLCADHHYMTDKDRTELKRTNPGSKEYKEILKKSDEKINKYYKIYSYNKFVEYAEKKQLNLNNTVLIIDEIQNMVSDDGKYYRVLYKLIHNAPSNLRVILLSATPVYDKPSEISLTMNLLRMPHKMPTGREFIRTFIDVSYDKNGEKIYNAKNMDLFKQLIKGYVSYFKGASNVSFPKKNIHITKCNMEDFQYKNYLSILYAQNKNETTFNKNLKLFKGDILELPSNFMLNLRVVSNVTFPNGSINAKGFKSFRGKDIAKLKNLKQYSIKFYKIMKRVKRSHGPCMIYSAFKGYAGLKSLIEVLKAQGYKDYKTAGQGRKRYCVWSGDEKPEYREEMKFVFNSKENFNGSRIKIILGSPAMREGLSIYNVRQVHVLDVYWNLSRLSQIYGRAVRFCSHKTLPKNERVVDIYLYLATHPKIKETVDQYIYKLALKKYALVEQFEMALKESAIDCELNANANEENEIIKCEK